MIYIDSNIPMYLIGAAHPNKGRAERILAELVDRDEKLVTSAEALQELLHRYRAIGRIDAVTPAFDCLLGLVDEVFPLTAAIATRARDELLGLPTLSSRDAVHVATMRAHAVQTVLSFDTDFDRVAGIKRLS